MHTKVGGVRQRLYYTVAVIGTIPGLAAHARFLLPFLPFFCAFRSGAIRCGAVGSSIATHFCAYHKLLSRYSAALWVCAMVAGLHRACALQGRAQLLCAQRRLGGVTAGTLPPNGQNGAPSKDGNAFGMSVEPGGSRRCLVYGGGATGVAAEGVRAELFEVLASPAVESQHRETPILSCARQ